MKDDAEQKIVEHLDEAYATEQVLVNVLRAQIEAAPKGSCRYALESHLSETRDHAILVRRRLRELGGSCETPVESGRGIVQGVLGQSLSRILGPALAARRMSSGLTREDEKNDQVLKNTEELCALEALEIANYTAIESFASFVGDDETEALARSIRIDGQKMLDLVLSEIPKLIETGVADAKAHRRRRREAPRIVARRVRSVSQAS